MTPSGHGYPRPNACFFSRSLSALTEVLGRDIRANDPRMSAGDPARKLPLWADFSFLILVKRENGFTKTLFSLFFLGFLSKGDF